MTLDHIIPLHQGGPHTEANLKPAHMQCNTLKEHGYTPEQMLEFIDVA